MPDATPDAAPALEYQLICENTPEELIATVNEFLRDGWQPLGGTIVIPPSDMNRLVFFQAVTRTVLAGDGVANA